MTQRIDLSRRDIWDGHFDDDPPPGATAREKLAVRAASELPALPDTDSALLARATGAAPAATTAPRPLLADGIDTQAVRAATPPRTQTATQARLDAFRASATPTFHTPEGDTAVSIGFWMNENDTDAHAKVVARNLPELRSAARAARVSETELAGASAGRASVEVVRRLTQALIEQGHLPLGDGTQTLSDRVRQLMFDHGIGVDCADYVRQALVAIHGAAWGRVHLHDASLEDLSGLAGRGYRPVAESDLRPGDIIALRPPPGHRVGHRVIVFEQHTADAAELADLKTRTSAAIGERVRVIVVDSSWGSLGIAQHGGVDRRTWWHDQTSGKWLWTDDKKAVHVTDGPYDHPMDDMYRAPERP